MKNLQLLPRVVQAFSGCQPGILGMSSSYAAECLTSSSSGAAPAAASYHSAAQLPGLPARRSSKPSISGNATLAPSSPMMSPAARSINVGSQKEPVTKDSARKISSTAANEGGAHAMPVPAGMEDRPDYAHYCHPHKFPYVMVDPTPWGAFTSYAMMCAFIGLGYWFHSGHLDTLAVGMVSMIYMLSQWWRDIVREGLLEGKHTIAIQQQFRFAFVLFILSEVMFFFSMFWGYYHLNSNPIWLIYPSDMIIKGWGLPLLNTFILLSSGAAVTWSHHAIIAAKELAKKAPK